MNNEITIDSLVSYIEHRGLKMMKQDETTIIPQPKFEAGIESIEFYSNNLIHINPQIDVSYNMLEHLKPKLIGLEKDLSQKGYRMIVRDKKEVNPEHISKTIQQYFESKLNHTQQSYPQNQNTE